jgi:hypothetical protein
MTDTSTPLSTALASERVVAVGHAGYVCLIDATTGRTIWERSLAEIAGAAACAGQAVSVAVADETVLAGSMGHLFALRIEDGSILWHVDRRNRGAGDTSLSVGHGIQDYVASLGPTGGSG